jgi:hypothetical protein
MNLKGFFNKVVMTLFEVCSGTKLPGRTEETPRKPRTILADDKPLGVHSGSTLHARGRATSLQHFTIYSKYSSHICQEGYNYNHNYISAVV